MSSVRAIIYITLLLGFAALGRVQTHNSGVSSVAGKKGTVVRAHSFRTQSSPITAVAFSPDGSKIAVGGYRVVTLLNGKTGRTLAQLPGHTGRITSMAFSSKGEILAAAGGSPGQAGEIRLWNLKTGSLLATLTGHKDVIYAVAFSPNGRQLAAASYDHLVSLWNLGPAMAPRRPSEAHAKPDRAMLVIATPRFLKDHTDAVYAVAFSPDGQLVASAAGDRTVKVWDAATGKRLYTLSESTAELYAVAFRPDGRQLAAGGVDKTLRTWDISRTGGTLARSAFAHEGAILRVAYDHDGRTLFTAGEDKAVKQWDATTLDERAVYPPQPDWPQGMALSPNDRLLAVGRHDGSLAFYDTTTHRPLHLPFPTMPEGASAADSTPKARNVRFHSGLAAKSPATPTRLAQNSTSPGGQGDPTVMQVADNDALSRAQPVTVPVSIQGKLWNGKADGPAPSHYYRFPARKGQPLILDVMARRAGSPLDSEIEILDAQGKPVEQAVLRAVSRTEVTLSDRDSASPGIRLLALPDLHINDYMLVGREVIQVLALPKGPDDDTLFSNYRGQRLGFLGTTPEYHSIGAPVFKVEIHPPGSVFSPNGMPLTHLSYKNDDGGPLYGRDSYLAFTPPADGDYIVRLTDVRGQQGEKYTYRLRIHSPRPDYKVSLSPAQPAVPKGGSSVVTVECERYEGFNDAIDVRLEGLPPGFTASTGVIEAGATSADLLLTAAPDAETPKPPQPGSLRVVATAHIGGQEVVRTVEPDNMARRLKVIPPSTLQVATDRNAVDLHPGGEATVEVKIERLNKFGGRVPLDVRNLPFGVRVTDIGLNGVLITEHETSRKFVLYCEPWVKPQTRTFYTVANVEGGTGNVAPPLTLKIDLH